MLHPLIYLSALSLLAGAAAQQVFSISSELDISSCPITLYGQMYKQIYINFTKDHFVVCFDGFYDPQTRGDCLVGPSSVGAALEILPPNPSEEEFYFQRLPTIKTHLQGTVVLHLNHNGTSGTLVLANFGTQAALQLRSSSMGSVVYDVQIKGDLVNKLNVTNTPESQQEYSIIDVSGCRHLGVLYRPGRAQYMTSDEFCLACDVTAVIHTTGHGICQKGSTAICTVTGPTVIDLFRQVNSVQDRCAYALVSDYYIPDFLILGNFQERRRKDVSFLDSVTLRLDSSGVLIHLEQGGRVRLNNTMLTLNSSTQLVHGVELSKDQTGVTAKVSLPSYRGYTVSVFFDGYTAEMTFNGGSGVPVIFNGLCSNSSEWREARLSDYSANSCEAQYNDAADSTINCTWATTHCNLLQGLSFAVCNSIINPEPYITVCTETLCKYPAVDGLSCQLLEAYAKACSLRDIDTDDDWRILAGCYAPEAFCQNRTCSPHEFCGEKTDGETACFCRDIFASEYRARNTLGGSTICSQDSASLSLVGCLLEDKGIDYSTLHLNDQTCRGHMDQQTHMVTFSFNNSNTCGAVVTTNGSQIIYKNTVMMQNSSDIITRSDQVYIDFSCVRTQPGIKTMSFKIKDSSVIQHITSGAWSYSLTMNVYNDAERTQAVDPSTAVQLDQSIWVELKTDGLDDSLVAVVTDSCWATSEPSPSGSLRYDLIINGCANPTDQTVKVEGNGLGTSNYFTFNLFQFTGKSGDIYLHCKLQLCIKENNCLPVCKGASRRRRSLRPKNKDDAAAVISMAWSN
ncbi:Alpha-tectorin Precursor [Channa argus]|uniref:Alpha-tectorin n=1 Tax=Channa argus TaxID=215402 RepID=A0A6G1Q785_CHAAH|nr:Alpha-tectorin Precursor [Channa argus]